MELAAKAKRRDAAVASLCLAGSYSRVPGITDLVAKAFQCRVVVPEHPEEAMVRGCQRVLADLKFLLPHFGSKP
jgi:sugar (pentulose or hexulose) kinase